MGNETREPEQDPGLTLAEEAKREGGWRGVLEPSQMAVGRSPKARRDSLALLAGGATLHGATEGPGILGWIFCIQVIVKRKTA